MSKLKLLGLCGALRASSVNLKLIREAARVFGDADYTHADLQLPLYDGDIETGPGIPNTVQVLADQIAGADAIVISTPEYNKSLSGVLKNALDWVSRTDGNPWRDKPVALMSAAAGRTGGEAAQMSLRLAMVSFRPRLISGPQMLLAGAGKAFDDDDRLIDERAVKNLTELMQALRDDIRR